jgi:hypothetical protein
MIEVFIIIADGTHCYYLLKVQRRSFDVYCFPPNLGIHVSLHKSGEFHFRFEENTKKPGKETPPVVLMAGEAGKPFNGGIICASLKGLGHAVGICTALFPIDSLGNNFQDFNRTLRECFVIDKSVFSKSITMIEVGIWAVPDKNKISFKYNNRNISEGLLYKMASCEPQIWIYAQPFA